MNFSSELESMHLVTSSELDTCALLRPDTMADKQSLPQVDLVQDFTECQTPVKRIFSADDIAAWLDSEAYARIMTVLVRCNLAIRSQGRRDKTHQQSDTTAAVIAMLDQLEGWIGEIPLDTGAQRFGNRAFRDWGRRLEEQSAGLHEKWIPSSHTAILPELLYYFENAFGNWTRIDYGSGHELSFLAYMTALRYTGLWQELDEAAMVFIVFERYLRLCRKLQSAYTLEPAGSKGVWGLEDHQFLNLLWGSSQLIGHDTLRPKDVADWPPEAAQAQEDHLFMSSIQHIRASKRGPFHEHSPVLFSIATTVPQWSKVNSGLLKMYQAEVLEKHPVVQHFWFGELLPWRRRGTSESLAIASQGRDESQPEAVDQPGTATSRPEGTREHLPPVATTVAPWARQSAAIPHLPGPGTGTPSRTINTAGLGTRNDRTSSLRSGPPMARQTPASLASTGSAAAASSPLGAISRPY